MPGPIEFAEFRAYNSGSMPPISGRVSFGEFELDLEAGKLRKSGRTLKLRPQPVRLLCLLVSHAGRPVSREEIRRHLWGESTFVDYDVAVDTCVNRIRSVLHDKVQAPSYVETLPRQGYRFIAPVKRQRLFAEPALAVLPFANLNGDPARDYFARWSDRCTDHGTCPHSGGAGDLSSIRAPSERKQPEIEGDRPRARSGWRFGRSRAA